MLVFEYLKAIVREAFKCILVLFTHQSNEVMTILSTRMHDKHMNMSFTSYLLSTKHFQILANQLIQKKELFSIEQASKTFLSHSRNNLASNDLTENRLYIENLRMCLQSILYVNTVIDKIRSLAKTHYNSTDSAHSKLLMQLWTNLKPNERVGSWGDIGFQGEDPATDFRGMGLLGLIQLEVFSITPIARDVLLDSNHPRRYYPFAATGINVSAFVLELLTEGRLHGLLFAKLDVMELDTEYSVNSSNTTPLDAFSNKALNIGCAEVHRLYCLVFEEFYRQWVALDPVNIMAFPGVFKTVKDHFRHRYPLLV